MDERRDSNRVVGGLVLLGLGLIFLLSNFGYFPSGLWGRWWPLILIAIGLIILLRRPEPAAIPPEPPFPPGETPPGMPPAPPTTAHRGDHLDRAGLGLSARGRHRRERLPRARPDRDWGGAAAARLESAEPMNRVNAVTLLLTIVIVGVVVVYSQRRRS